MNANSIRRLRWMRVSLAPVRQEAAHAEDRTGALPKRVIVTTQAADGASRTAPALTQSRRHPIKKQREGMTVSRADGKSTGITVGRLALGLLGCAALLLSGCGSSGSSGSGPVHVAIFSAFTGADAVDGPIQGAGCIAAQQAINAAGGVLGHKIACVKADSGSDPADAVPAADKMLADTSNLAAIVGPTEVAPSTEPIIKRSQVVMFSLSGDPRYDHSTDPYFYRILPSDDVAGTAMAYWAIHSGLKHAAFLFDNDVGSQTVVPSLTYAYKKLGGNVATSITLPPDQSNYRTEVEQLLASHPDGIVTETDAQTASTFFSELSELSGGHLVPIQSTATGLVPPYEKALAAAIGTANMKRYFSGTDISAPAPGAAYDAYKAALHGAGSAIPGAAQYESQPYTAAPYDALIAAALAMTATKSTTPSVYRAHIAQVTGAPRAGAVIVHTYPAGLAALKKGEQITYVGANGAMIFNRYQNAAGTFSAFRYDPANPELSAVAEIPASALTTLLKP